MITMMTAINRVISMRRMMMTMRAVNLAIQMRKARKMMKTNIFRYVSYNRANYRAKRCRLKVCYLNSILTML